MEPPNLEKYFAASKSGSAIIFVSFKLFKSFERIGGSLRAYIYVYGSLGSLGSALGTLHKAFGKLSLRGSFRQTNMYDDAHARAYLILLLHVGHAIQ